MDRPWAEIIEENPIGEGLDGFRVSFRSSCKATSIPSTAAALERFSRDCKQNGLALFENQSTDSSVELQNLLLILLSALQVLPAARILQSTSGKSIFIEISKLSAAIATDDFDLDHV